MTMNTNYDLGIHDLSPFQVHSRREIIALLRSIRDHNQLLSMLPDGTKEGIVTSILEIDEVHNKIIIDCAPTPEANKNIIESDNISFETVLESIRILFFASEVESCLYETLPALKIDLPPYLIRLQRREYYRVLTPITTPSRCTAQIPQDGEETVSVTLQNVSGGGIAIVDEKGLLDNTIGRIYRDCRIYLPGNTIVTTSLQIRNSKDVTLVNGKTIRRLGCLFIDLPKPMLATIQRYITKLEREQNAKSAGIN